MSKFKQISGAASGGFAVTASDSTTFTPVRCLYVGATGDVKVTTADGNDLTFVNAPIGILPVSCTKVFSTGTTATDIVALT